MLSFQYISEHGKGDFKDFMGISWTLFSSLHRHSIAPHWAISLILSKHRIKNRMLYVCKGLLLENHKHISYFHKHIYDIWYWHPYQGEIDGNLIWAIFLSLITISSVNFDIKIPIQKTNFSTTYWTVKIWWFSINRIFLQSRTCLIEIIQQCLITCI